jgi:hypothetical protein
MTGQIPPYGKDFRRESIDYHPTRANRVYRLKADPSWFIWADKTSEWWVIYHGSEAETADAVTDPKATFSEAMRLLLAGVAGGFYRIAQPGEDREPAGLADLIAYAAGRQPSPYTSRYARALDPMDLDEVIRDLAGKIAGNASSDGIPGQVRWLLETYGYNEARQVIRDVIEGG